MILLDELLAAGGELHGPRQAERFADWSYDSRLTAAGECFVALRTPRADGHEYLSAALAAGATGLLCRWAPPDGGAASVVLADDPQALLGRWASARLAALAPTVVGVTGSVGKTTTRRAVAAVLAARGPTFQSRRSFNSLLGLPVALARLQASHRFAVLEYGSDRRGEIARLAALFPPHIAIVTAVGEAHLGGLGDLEGVAAEKGALLAALPPNGLALLNGDDERVLALAERSPAAVLSYGLGAHNQLRASAVRYGVAGTTLRLAWRGQTVEAQLAGLGEPAVYAALAAVGVGLNFGLELAECAAALFDLEPAAGRLRPLPAHGGATLLDDSFSAAPPAAYAALRTLAALPARRRIAVLGALSDLPPNDGPRLARELGALAARCADQLVLKGDWGVVAARAARAIRPDLPIAVVDTDEAVIAALPADLGPGDLVLLKGGAEARLERLVARLLDEEFVNRKVAKSAKLAQAGALRLRTSNLEQLLVRQEPVWRSISVGVPGRPTWLRVDLDAVASNLRQLRTLGGVPLMAVLKGDAYGHGAVRVARTALVAGAAALAVATLGEAALLREHEIAAPVLVLGYTPPWQAAEAARLKLDLSVFDDQVAAALGAVAASLGQQLRVHVKVDTGMGRLGLLPNEVGAFLARLRATPGLEVAGLYTHFANADDADLDFTQLQLARFTALLRELEAAGLRPPLVHAANSAAALRVPAARFDMIRPGIACYGLNPSPDCRLPAGFRPALSLHSEVAQVKLHPPGAPISYGGTFVTTHPTLIATVPVGYADGVRRSPPWRELLVRGQRAPIVGRICMDYLMADVSAVAGVRRGDAVVLLGRQGNEQISADEVASWLGTNSYEVVTGMMPRVPREVAD